MKKVLLLIIPIFLLTGCYDKYKIPEDIWINYDNKEIEVYTSFESNDFNITSNAQVKLENTKISTNNIGEYEIEVPIVYNKKNYIYKLNYSIIDTTAPKYISASSYQTVTLNSETDFCSNIVFGDNYDREPTCRIEGYYDITTTGKYNVEYVISDSSNNETKKNLTINVVDKLPTTTTTTTKKTNLSFSDVIENYKNDNTMIGIDVSRYQGDIDFEKIKEAGCEFVIMRIGINSDINKDLSMDTYYLQNIEGAKSAGLKVGIYLYSSATNVDTALEHAKWVIKNLNNTELDLGIAYDWENWSKFRTYNMSFHDLNNVFDAFASYIKNHGYTPILYSSKFYLENIWENKNNESVWLAHYTANTSYSGNYYIWQMSNIGKIDGINADVDIDILYK
jgi:GH25 family lysozyme M1 (1,4-beta-N-acetylmuramidase)